jgi:hypothetical protein
MSIDKLSENWIFQQHSKNEIIRWINALKYFQFKRAWGGHANDGDEFKVKFLFVDENDLHFKLNLLEITLNIIPNDYPRPIPGKSYTPDEFEIFKSGVSEFPHLEQPRHSIIFNEKVFIWVYDGNFEVTISGSKDENYYYVSENDFEKCIRLEKQFDILDWQKYIYKEPDVCVLSKENYPELYISSATAHNSG